MSKKENIKNIADLLPEAISNAMSEESLSVLKEEFERLVESKVAERIGIATAAAEAALDEEVNKKCVELVQKIEEAHSRYRHSKPSSGYRLAQKAQDPLSMS